MKMFCKYFLNIFKIVQTTFKLYQNYKNCLIMKKIMKLPREIL